MYKKKTTFSKEYVVKALEPKTLKVLFNKAKLNVIENKCFPTDVRITLQQNSTTPSDELLHITNIIYILS